MPGKPDYVRKKYAPLLDRNLTQALAHLLGREFPRLGGERFLRLCSEMILEFLADHIRTRDAVSHGQVLWFAISANDPPARGKRIADTNLVPVVLDLSTPGDVQAIIGRESPSARLLAKAIRLCEQANEQGGLLGNSDLSELLACDNRHVSQLLADHERETERLVPRRATVHDVGTGLTHKRIICWKRYAEGKSPEQVARETYHSLEAVDRYLGQFDRVRHCRKINMPSHEIAYTLRCSSRLVAEYAAIDEELNRAKPKEAANA